MLVRIEWSWRVSPRGRSMLFDVLVSATVVLLTSFTLKERYALALGLAMAGAVLFRRRWPLPTLAAVAAVALAQVLTNPPGHDPLPYDIAIPIAMYSVVKYAPRLRDAYLAAAVAAGGVVVEMARYQGTDLPRRWPEGTFYATIFTGIWLSGYVVRTRRQYVATLEERAATLERERQHLAEIAVARERATIAREMHDVVAHSLAVIIVQADGGRYAMTGDPERGRAVLETVAVTARDALEEMRRLIDLLRAGDNPDDPDADRRIHGLADLGPLVHRARAAGLDVTLDAGPVPLARTSPVGVAAYRIVQEALTNVIRHAGPHTRCTVTIATTSTGAHPDREPRPAEAVRIDVTDDGTAPPPLEPRGRVGHGLVGMRERATVLGGTFDAGPRAGGGWRVHATLPISAADRADPADRAATGPTAEPVPGPAGGSAAPAAGSTTEPAGPAATEPAAGPTAAGDTVTAQPEHPVVAR